MRKAPSPDDKVGQAYEARKLKRDLDARGITLKPEVVVGKITLPPAPKLKKTTIEKFFSTKKKKGKK